MSLIDLLSDGEIHSGEELGRALGVSRAAVWKQIEGLRRKGVGIEVAPGRGYRLQGLMEPWNEARLLDLLSLEARAMLQRLEVRRTTGSTNDDVADLMRRGTAGAVVCLAEEQTSGRGRRGREWYSPWGRSFYCSFGWTFAEGLSALEGLSLAVGVALVRALGRYGIEGVGLKWPNDLEVDGAKLGGILIEIQAEAGGHCQAIIGVGLNLSLPADAAARLGRPVTDVASLKRGGIARNQLGALLIEEVLLLLRDYPQSRFGAVREEWLRLDVLRGMPVEVSGLQQVVMGIGCGVDERGALLVETCSGMVTVQAGEVSLRRRP
jgi:BirA family biotin operon repressor/biotin-[acetyl-CoA-carboxylase] ligase